MSTTVSTATRGSFYRPELDVLRFVCFLLIFLHHAVPRYADTLFSAVVDACAFGMPVFFLLSSFLITELLVREQSRTGRVHIPAFYVRRVLRIWPLYFAFFAFCAALGGLHLLMHPISVRATLFFLLLAGNWYLVLYGPLQNAIVVLWSISVEEQFYLVWPWLMRLGGTRVLRWVAAIVCPLAYVAIALLSARGASPDLELWSNTLVQMQFFPLGGLLALYLSSRRPHITRTVRALLVAGTVLAWVSAAFWCRLKRFDLHITPQHACLGYLLVAAGAASMFVAFYGFQVGTGWLPRTLVYLGKVSFGLYVFHYFALMFAESAVHHIFHLRQQFVWMPALPLAFALTILFASISYRFLEKPLLRYKERFTFVQSRPL